MARNDFEQLKTECGKFSAVSEQKLLDVGETIWLTGRAAASGPGTVALNVGSGQSVVIREQDVLEVEKHGSRFYAKVKRGVDVLYRLEQVVQANPDKCTCRGDTAGGGSAGSGVIKRKSDGSGVNNNEDDLPQSMDCRVEYVITFWCLPGKVEGNACVPILNRIIVCEPSDVV
jgi:hypothetical protein